MEAKPETNSIRIMQDLHATSRMISLLESSKTNVENIVSTLPDFILFVDPSGQVLKANSTVAQFLSVPEEDIFKHTVFNLFDDEIHDFIREKMTEATALPKTASIEFESNISNSYGKKPIFWSLKKLKVEHSVLTSLFCFVGRDISLSVLLDKKTRLLELQKKRIQIIIENASQGFFTCASDFKIEETFSSRIISWLGVDPEGMKVWEAFGIEESKIRTFGDAVFLGDHWDLLKDLARFETQVSGRSLRLDFSPIREKDSVIRMLGTVSDITDEKRLKKQAQDSTEELSTLSKVMKFQHLFAFLLNRLRELKMSLKDPEQVKHLVHTLKGELGFFGFISLSQRCHEWEDILKKSPSIESNLRFYDQISMGVEKFIKKYSYMLSIDEKADSRLQVNSDTALKNLLAISKMAASPKVDDLLLGVFEVEPSHYFSWLDQVWQNAAMRTGKLVNPLSWEKSNRIFPYPYRKLFSSLIHLLNNSIDHGIELPEERIAQGKPMAGSLFLSLKLKKDTYILSVRDDGRGVKLDPLRSTASRLGMSAGSDQDLLKLIFLPGFSTKGSVTEISGRGVGLSALMKEAKSLGGTIEVKSREGEGTTFTIFFKKANIKQSFEQEKEISHG